MSIEIERKFLVTDDSYTAEASAVFGLKQGYLSRDINRTVRVRTLEVKRSKTWDSFYRTAYITVKGLTVGCSRPEFEYEVPYADGIAMLELCDSKVIEKTRYVISKENCMWEVDEFHGTDQGLVIAEIELTNETDQFELPSWVGKEVTGNILYYNSNM